MSTHQLVGQYGASMRRRRFAPGTISARLRVARLWLEHAGPGWTTSSWHDIDAYGDTRHVAASTWRDEVSHLSHFYRWAMRNELAAADPTVLVERPRVGMRYPRPATPMQYRRLLVGASPRVRAVVELMAWGGLRCCEVASLRWCDVDLVRRVAIVHGKGNRDRDVALSRQVIQALAAIDGTGDDFVIESPTGLPLSAAAVSKLVGDWARDLGVPITAHMLRHKFATYLLEAADGDIMVVKEALGHASVATTEIYARVSRLRAQKIARLIDAYEQSGLFEENDP